VRSYLQSQTAVLSCDDGWREGDLSEPTNTLDPLLLSLRFFIITSLPANGRDSFIADRQRRVMRLTEYVPGLQARKGLYVGLYAVSGRPRVRGWVTLSSTRADGIVYWTFSGPVGALLHTIPHDASPVLRRLHFAVSCKYRYFLP